MLSRSSRGSVRRCGGAAAILFGIQLRLIFVWLWLSDGVVGGSVEGEGGRAV
jgi:hypothetical protein